MYNETRGLVNKAVNGIKMKLEYYISNKQARRAKRLVSELCIKKTALGVFYQLAVFISTLFIGFSLMQLIPNTKQVYEAFPYYMVCLGILAAGVFLYFFGKWFVTKKAIERTGLLKSKITYEILPDKIIHYMDDGLKLEITGNDIKQFVDYKDYLFMFVRENYAYYIPPTVFIDKSQRESIKNEIISITNNR
ncbi:MAG: YcxB family protein [Candidatus Thiodiazotropha sp.]